MKSKKHFHFDNMMTLKDAKEYVKDLHSHQYLPFITYKKDKNKWDDNHKKTGESRTISVASNKDNYVYQYYNDIISEAYEKYIRSTKYDNSVCAYRKGKHKCNIDFFAETYNYLKKSKNAKIFIGDISKFFDNLDHKILKDNLKTVLNISELDDDMYNMLKSLEKFSYIEIDDIIKFLNEKGIYINIGKEKYRDICEYCNEHKVKNIVKQEWFKELKEKYLKPTKEELKDKKKGIVQGSSVSGTLSNIYMINVDKQIYELLSNYKYFYRRYCDDFIVIIRNIDDKTYNDIIEKIKNIITENKLELKDSKIQKFDFNNGIITGSRNFIQFLGFEMYDNYEVKVRQSTMDRWRHKILKSKKRYEKLCIFLPEEKVREIYKQYNYDKLENVRSDNYKECTLGTYIHKSNNKIASPSLKKTSKELVNFIDKHLK